jgi:hypothetical protein
MMTNPMLTRLIYIGLHLASGAIISALGQVAGLPSWGYLSLWLVVSLGASDVFWELAGGGGGTGSPPLHRYPVVMAGFCFALTPPIP